MTDGLQLFEPRWTKKLLNRIDLAHNGTLLRNIQPEQLDAYLALWAGKCTGLTADQVKHGIAVAERMTKPPTPSEFRLAAIKAPAHQPFPALSAPEITPEQRKANIDRIGREIKKSRFMRRCLTRLGYGPTEHAAALSLARAEGRSLYAVDMAAMIENGWSEDLEAQHRRGWMAVPGNRLIAANGRPDRRALYTPGREPPDWVIRAGVQELTTIENWIAEQAAAATAAPEAA